MEQGGARDRCGRGGSPRRCVGLCKKFDIFYFSCYFVGTGPYFVENVMDDIFLQEGLRMLLGGIGFGGY